MKGTIANYRGSRRRKRGNYLLISIADVDSREKAQKLVGKTVTWTSPGKSAKKLVGTITGAHGNSGIIKALFNTGMPGQSLGTHVSIE